MMKDDHVCEHGTAMDVHCCNCHSGFIFDLNHECLETNMSRLDAFEKDLEHLLNKHSMENDSNTPDFILARYLVECLHAWNEGILARETWYGRKIESISSINQSGEKNATEVSSLIVE